MKALRSKSIKLFDRQKAPAPAPAPAPTGEHADTGHVRTASNAAASHAAPTVSTNHTSIALPRSGTPPPQSSSSAPSSPIVAQEPRAESLTDIVLRLERCIGRVRVCAVSLEREGLHYEAGRYEDAVRALVGVHARLSDYRSRHADSHAPTWSGEARDRRASGETGRDIYNAARKSLDVHTVAEHLSTTTLRLEEYCDLVLAPLFKREVAMSGLHRVAMDGKKRLLQAATVLCSRAATLADLAAAIR